MGKQLGFALNAIGQPQGVYLDTAIPGLKPKDSDVSHAESGNDGYIDGMWTFPKPSGAVLFVTKVLPSGLSYLYKGRATMGNNPPTYDNKQAVLNLGDRNGTHQPNIGILNRNSVLVATINNTVALFYGEYRANNPGGVVLWKSTDMGDTWSPMLEWSTADNIHGIKQNPANGWIYIMMDSGIIAWDGVSSTPPNNTPLNQIGNYPGWKALTGPANVVSTGDLIFTPAPDNKVLWIPGVHSLPAGGKLLSYHANTDLTGLAAVGEVPFVNGHPPAIATTEGTLTGNAITWASGIDASASERKIDVWQTTDFGAHWILRSKVNVYNSGSAVPFMFKWTEILGREMEFVPTGLGKGSTVDYLQPPYLVQKLLKTVLLN